MSKTRLANYVCDETIIFGAGDVVANRLLPSLQRNRFSNRYQIFHDGVDDVSGKITSFDAPKVLVSHLASLDAIAPSLEFTNKPVFVATPPGPRKEIVQLGLSSGALVIAEKPLFISEDDKFFYKKIAGHSESFFPLSYYMQEKALALAWLTLHDPDCEKLLVTDSGVSLDTIRDTFQTLGPVTSIDIVMREGVEYSASNERNFWYECEERGVWFDMGVHVVMLVMMVNKEPLILSEVDTEAHERYFFRALSGECPVSAEFGKGYAGTSLQRDCRITYQGGVVEGDFNSCQWTIHAHGHNPYFIRLPYYFNKYDCLVKKVINFISNNLKGVKTDHSASLNLQIQALSFLSAHVHSPRLK